jgi:hypothetical protein
LGGVGVERFGGGVSIRDLPPRRNLNFNQATSSSSCTGRGELRREGGDEVSSPAKNHGARAGEVGSGKEPMEIVSKKSKGARLSASLVNRWESGKRPRVHPLLMVGSEG